MAVLVGLTGAIASGKSTALFLFGEMGAAVLSTDALVAEMLATDTGVQRQLADRWGEHVIGSDGRTDRSAVAKIVFNDPAELEWLEKVTHPVVRQRVAEWRDSLGDDVELAVVEVPLLFEGDMHRMFDVTVTVTASDEERRRRIENRRLVQVEEREARQLSPEEKAARADFVLENPGELDRFTQAVADLWPQISARARNHADADEPSS